MSFGTRPLAVETVHSQRQKWRATWRRLREERRLTRPESRPERIGRNLRLFHSYRLLSTSYLFVPVLVHFFLARGLSFTQMALLNTVYAVTAVLCDIPTGALADRFGRRRAMIAGALSMALGCFIDYRSHTFSGFALGEGLLALGLTLSSGADSAYLYDLLRAAGRSREYRRFEGSATAMKLSGAALALIVGGFIGGGDPASTYLGTMFICGVAALCAFFLDESPLAEEPRRFWPTISGALRLVLSHSRLQFGIAFSVVMFTLLRMGLYLYPPYLRVSQFSFAQTGLVLAALSLVGAFAAYRVETIRRVVGENRLLWLLPLTVALAHLALGRWFIWCGTLFLALQAVANGLYSPISKQLINREITDSQTRATVLSVESMARRICFGAFAPLAGIAIDRHSLGSGFLVCAVFGLLAVPLLYLAVKLYARHRCALHLAACDCRS